MINTTTYANAWTYLQENELSAKLFHFIHITDHNGNDYYYSNYYDRLGDYIPNYLTVSPVTFRANLFEGSYSISNVSVTMDNTDRPQADTTTKRFSENFSSNVFENQDCIIYLGYDGIAAAADLFPYFKGRVADFQYNVLTITFNVIDRAILELPNIPPNKFTRASYANIDQEMIDKPIPIVYGRWDDTGFASQRYFNRSFIPAYVIENNFDSSTPQLKLEMADHALDRVGSVFVYDDTFLTVGEILDDIAGSAANSTATIDLNTYNTHDYMTARFFLYPTRHTAAGGDITNPGNAYDGKYDSYASMDGQSSHAITMGLGDNMGSIPPAEMDIIYGDTTGESSAGLRVVEIQIAGYPASAYVSGEKLTISIANSAFTEDVTDAQVNGLSDVASFNHTLSGNLQINNPRKFNGTTALFEFDENGTTGDIIPAAGYYPTMDALAREAEAKIEEGAFTDSYAVAYVKNLNKMRITKLSGSLQFRGNSKGYSADIGFTTGTPSYQTTTFTGNTFTILDVPDGDFSQVQLKVANITLSSKDFRLKGARIRTVRSYRDYNVTEPDPPPRWADLRRVEQIDRFPYIRFYRLPRVVTTDPKFSTDLAQRQSIRNTLSSGRFYAGVDGQPTGATYFQKPGEIIKDVLETQASVAAGDIDSAKFTTADTDTQVDNLSLYLSEETPTREVITNLAKYGFGFVFVTQAGQYAFSNIKSSYSSGDIDFTLEYRDIAEPLRQNLNIFHARINDIATSLEFHAYLNLSNGRFMETISKTATNNLGLAEKNYYCPYITDDTAADTVAEYFCGDGATLGQFGKQRVILKFTTLSARWQFAELGDIVATSTELDTYLDGFGQTLSGLYFKIVEKRFDNRSATFKAVEVG